MHRSAPGSAIIGINTGNNYPKLLIVCSHPGNRRRRGRLFPIQNNIPENAHMFTRLLTRCIPILTLILALESIASAQSSPGSRSGSGSAITIGTENIPDVEGSGSGPGYIENRGQWDSRARFLVRSRGLDLWISGSGMTYNLYRYQSDSSVSLMERDIRSGRHLPPDRRLLGHVVRATFTGASGSPTAYGVDRTAGYYNYFIGDDPHMWTTDVPLYQSVQLEQIYPGIDARFYTDGGFPRYDLIVAPGADPRAIAMEFAGAGWPYVEANGALVIETSVGALRQEALQAYQVIDGARRTIPCRFSVESDGRVGFDVGAYDPHLPLIIDPLVYSTFLGGTTTNYVSMARIDTSGNVYIVGSTQATDYPTTTGAYQTSSNKLSSNSSVGFITKLNPGGSALVFSTYLGGRASSDNAQAIAIDTGRNIYVTGSTYNTSTTNDFPITSGAYVTTRPGGNDAYVAKLNAAGNTLLYSTFLGSTGNDAGTGIAVNPQGNAYVIGQTNGTFPTTTGAYSTTRSGADDNFVTKLNTAGSGLVYSTYLGGSSSEYPADIALDSAGNVYVAGATGSSNFPTTTGAFDRTQNTTNDGFITKLNPAGSGLVYSTYFGGTATESIHHIVVHTDGSAYIVGYTTATDLPTTTGAYRTTSNGGPVDGFVARLNATGTGLIYSTYMGGSGHDVVSGIALDRKGNATITGLTTSSGFPTTANAYDRTYHGGDDVFITRLNFNGTALLYSTLVGGSNDDDGTYIQTDPAGNAYVVGTTLSTNFPSTASAYDTTNNGEYFALKIQVPSITLTSPAGGETWCSGTVQPITWINSGVDSVTIELSTDGGAIYNALVRRAAGQAGSWNWSIPASMAQGSNYIVRIYDATNSVIADTGRVFTINRPPAITVPPANLTLCPGQQALFSVTATGVGQSYQWRKNLTPIPGATGSTFTIPSVQSTDAGTYDVVVSGTCSPAAISNGAVLTVNVPPSITSQLINDTLCEGSSKTYTISATGTALTYQWRKDGNNITGATGPTYSIASVLPNHAGQYDVVVSGACQPSVTSSPAVLGVIPAPAITTQPRGVSACPGDSVAFAVSATGAGISYQWRKDGNNITGATTSTFTIPATQRSDSGNYDVIVSGSCPGDVISSVARLIINQPPEIITEPKSVSVCSGQPATLTTLATGAGITYQWRKRGIAIPGATGLALSLPSVTAADTGSYDVIASGTCLPPDTSLPALIAIAKTTSITITTQPPSKSVCLGQKLVLDVVASGASLSYQWRKNGQNLSGATGSGFTIASSSLSDSGSYDVVISSPCGQPVTSQAATVTINQPVAISTQPQNQTAVAGGTASFSIVATGSGRSYQWRKNGALLPGANGASYSITSVAVTDSGTYDVIVSGLCGSPDTSNGARLDVVPMLGVTGSDEATKNAEASLIVIPLPARGMTRLLIRFPHGLHPEMGADLYLYDALGRKVLDLGASFEQGGYDQAEFDAGPLPSGIYYCRISTARWDGMLGIVVVAK
jgi:hypothetical protein